MIYTCGNNTITYKYKNKHVNINGKIISADHPICLYLGNKNRLAIFMQKNKLNHIHPETLDLQYEKKCRKLAKILNNNIHNKNDMWLLKPKNMSRGAEIYIIKSRDDIKKIVNIRDKISEYIAQKYIRTKLLYNKKFDFRFQ